MISKVAFVQPICDYRNHDMQKPKEGADKKKSTSFANILEKAIKSKITGNKQIG